MKKISTILAFLFITVFTSCEKEDASVLRANCSLQDPPTWCASVRCNPDGKPVCGCNNITYASVCVAQCSGVTLYTMGECK